MFYTIYKITNTINSKIYVGKHQTKNLDDGYMGSGKHLNRAIEKYGIENFKKEFLFIFDNERDMNAKEAELVTEEFVKEDTNYNLCPGGRGGFGYINTNDLNEKTFKNKSIQKIASKRGAKTTNNRLKTDKNFYESWRKSMIGRDPSMLGKTHSEESKKKISATKKINGSGVGSKNSQFGTMWITNGKENKKIKKNVDTIPEGWYKGRKKLTRGQGSRES